MISAKYLTQPSLMTAFAILTIPLVIQGLHIIEHIAQIIQKFALNLPIANGVLGHALDIEPVHFAYNIIYLSLMAFVWIVFTKNTSVRNMRLVYGLITFVLIFQVWHFTEHIVKLQMHFVEGCLSCPGIIGHFINLPILHFVYNLIVFVPVLIVYIILQYKMTLVIQEKKLFKE